MDDFPTMSNLTWTLQNNMQKLGKKLKSIPEVPRPTLVIPTHLGVGYVIIQECQEKWTAGKSNAWETEVSILSNIIKSMDRNGTFQDKHEAYTFGKELKELVILRSGTALKPFSARLRESFNSKFMLWPPMNSANWVNQHTDADGRVTDIPKPRSTYIRMGIPNDGMRGIQEKAYREARKAFELQKLSHICRIAKNLEDVGWPSRCTDKRQREE